MKVTETGLPGVFVFEPRVFKDPRGFFLETYREDLLLDAGIDKKFVQDNHSRSTRGILRGLHYQLEQPQGKLVRVVTGRVFDVAVDVRKDSPHFGKWFGCELDEENKKSMYIPEGFAHGFAVLSETADFVYKCTDYYHPQSEQGIIWNDPMIAIRWPIDDVLLSEKDAAFGSLKDQPAHRLPAMVESPA